MQETVEECFFVSLYIYQVIYLFLLKKSKLHSASPWHWLTEAQYLKCLFFKSTEYSHSMCVVDAFGMNVCRWKEGERMSLEDGASAVLLGGGRSYLCVGVVNWKSRFIRALAEDSPLPFQDNEKIGAGIKIWPLQKLKVHQGRKMNNLVLPQAEFWVSMPFQFTYIL